MSDTRECLLDHPDGSIESELAQEMHGISQDYWCAGWVDGLEFYLWDWMTGKTDAPVTVGPALERCAALRGLCGKWIFWDPEVGAVAISMDDWKELLDISRGLSDEAR